VAEAVSARFNTAGADEVLEAFATRGPCDKVPTSGKVRVIAPEALSELDRCRWDGDGHFDMTQFHQKMPPSLGQVCKYMRLLDAMAEECSLVVHLSTESERAVGSTLAGAYMVCAKNCSGQQAWQAIQKASPPPSAQASLAWDRFPLPFAPHVEQTTATSCTVRDCLDGMEVARDLCWLDYRKFDVEAFALLRRKFDASWIIPGEMLALGDPSLTARNPAYPDLLRPGTKGPPEELSHEESEVSMLNKDTFVSLLQRVGVGSVVRLNRLHEVGDAANVYDSIFQNAGVEVVAFEFNDGESPPKGLVKAFVADARRRRALTGKPVLALHCKAGLGRTGVVAGAYAAELYKVNGKAFHGWARMSRPGSIQTHMQERYLRAIGGSSSQGSCSPCVQS
jgi:protein-tyrosine phosphatase